jgi:predicted ATPase/DNA-binding SARP family transcriptional activator
VSLEVELLGPPGLVVDGHRQPLPGRARALLALLALDAPRPVSSDRLLDALWGEDLPADPPNALQQRVSALRRLIDPERRGEVLVTTPGGYALHLTDEAIDARRFLRLADRGTELLTAGDAAGARQELTAALELWRGETLDGVADEPWARADVARLEERRLTAVEDRHDAALALGAGPELVAELADQVARHPLRERPAGQLMLALSRGGRQAEALEVHDRIRRLLADELGVDPGPALQRVYRQVLDQSGDAATPVTAPAPSTRIGNLPARTSSVVGRDEAMAAVGGLLDVARVVTLTGPGGTGKTTLAVEVARRRTPAVHGTWSVELARLVDGSAVVGEVATVLDLGAGGLGAPGTDAASLADALRDRQLLLVLDNAEHVVEEVAALVGQLVAVAPGVSVLTTSREPLGVPGEQVWPVPPLEIPGEEVADHAAVRSCAAVRLLVERARSQDPWFALTDEQVATAASVVRHLDGIPLAIELAAAQLRVLSLDDLESSLDDRFGLLTSPVRGVPARQATLRGALDWSWDLLDEVQRTAWAALATVAGRFDLDVAGRLLAAAGVEGRPLAVVRDLVDRSLLQTERRGGSTSYGMLETIRAYGRERLAGSGVAHEVLEAHAVLVEAALAACQPGTDPARFEVDLEGLASWLDDARAVLDRAASAGDQRRVQRVAGQLGWTWLLSGLAAEGLGWLDRGLGPVDAVSAAAVDPGAALWASGLRLGGVAADGSRWAAIAADAARGPSDRVLATVFAAIHGLHAGDLDRYRSLLAEARALAEPIGGWPLGFWHLIAAQLGRLTGRVDDLRRDAETALALLEGPGLRWGRVYAIDIIIDAVVSDPDDPEAFVRARDLATEGLELCAGLRLPELEARLRLQLGRALHELGDPERGRRHVDEAVRLAASAGRGVGYGFALLVAGTIARHRGEPAVAAAQLREARELLEGTGAPFGAVEVNAELAWAAIVGGDDAQVLAPAVRALSIAHEAGEPGMLARALETAGAAVAHLSEAGASGAARTAGASGASGAGGATGGALTPVLAARLLASAAGLRARTGHRTSTIERRDLDLARAMLASAGWSGDLPDDAAPDAVGDLLTELRGGASTSALTEDSPSTADRQVPGAPWGHQLPRDEVPP